MNELIKKFARESHIDVYGLGKDRDKWEATLEKFAELIVRECVGVADHSNINGKSIIGQRIKEHFGVEE
jgi:hypothetical protein